MDMDLKKQLTSKLEAIAPEYGMIELSFPSFMRCYGYRSQPLSAADTVEAISALLDVSGLRMEVEVEGNRNGGEWFGGGKVWNGGKEGKYREEDRENVPPGGFSAAGYEKSKATGDQVQVDSEKSAVDGWMRNFWASYDGLTE
jgi:cell division control protein 45